MILSGFMKQFVEYYFKKKLFLMEKESYPKF